MFVFIVVMYSAVAFIWLIGWGIQFEENYGSIRQRAAIMMLSTPIWPLMVLGWFLYGVYVLIKVALGRGDY